MPTRLYKSDTFDIGKERSASLLYWVLTILSVVALCGFVPIISPKAGATLIGVSVMLIWVVISFIRSKFHFIVLAWLAVYPYCYYFFSFPRERSIVTVDRVLIILIVIEMVLSSRQSRGAPLTRDIRVAAYLWATYCSVCLISIAGHPVLDVLGSYRLLLDGLIMPALLGLYATKFFPVVNNLNKIHACVCTLMATIAIVTGFELFTGTNLLPSTGAVNAWVQADAFRILRVDGPFENSGVLCLVGMLGFFLIIYCRRLAGSFFTRKQTFLHAVGIWAALGCAFMPMNRGLFIALIICAGVDYVSGNPLISRAIWNSIMALLAFFALFTWISYPSVFEDRVSRPDNVYQRIAQDRQTLGVIREHPLFGVGFNLYHDTVQGDPQYTARWKGFEAMDFPHNSAFAVLAEEGGLGFLLYIAAQIFLVRAMWSLRKVNRLGWRVFLYCTLVYTIYGLDAGMAYFSDLNLFYMFVLGVILQVQLRVFAAEPRLNGIYCG